MAYLLCKWTQETSVFPILCCSLHPQIVIEPMKISSPSKKTRVWQERATSSAYILDTVAGRSAVDRLKRTWACTQTVNDIVAVVELHSNISICEHIIQNPNKYPFSPNSIICLYQVNEYHNRLLKGLETTIYVGGKHYVLYSIEVSTFC